MFRDLSRAIGELEPRPRKTIQAVVKTIQRVEEKSPSIEELKPSVDRILPFWLDPEPEPAYFLL